MGIKVHHRGGYGAGRGDNPHQTRTEPHPLQSKGAMDTVGTYKGWDKVTDEYLFSADATGGDETDSIRVPRHPSQPILNVGDRYTFSTGGNSRAIRPYDPKSHYGLPGAPMADTPKE